MHRLFGHLVLNTFLEINYVSHRNKNMNMVLLLSISLTWNHIYVFILKRHIWLSRLGHQYLLKWSTIRQLFRPWTNFHIHLSRHVKALVYAVTTATLGNGTNLPFWSDRWLAGQSIADLAPAVVATLSPRVIKCRWVASALPENAWIRDISGTLSTEAIILFLQLADITAEQSRSCIRARRKP